MHKKILFVLILSFSMNGYAIGKFEFTPRQLLRKIQHQQVDLIIDLREQEAYDKGHIPHALHINVTDLGKAMPRLLSYRDKRVVIYCGDGTRAAIGMIRLQKEGFTRVHNLHGNLNAWKREALPLETHGEKTRVARAP